MAIHLLGIRHHGPGSSRNVLRVLQDIRPDLILIEGPIEANNLISWSVHEEMKPPVALLAYANDDPTQAVFYPFTEFSPEWNAMQFAVKEGIKAEFMDLPMSNSLAVQNAEDHMAENQDSNEIITHAVREDPIRHLAKVAGFEDGDIWWEHQVERAKEPLKVFEGIAVAMEALREAYPEVKEKDLIREAHMRKIIKKAIKDGYEDIAVVCGAWHVPALQELKSHKGDAALLKGLPKKKVSMTWVPWTFTRMSFSSGYGAGVSSPGWYRYLWEQPEDDGTWWLAKTASVFRKNSSDISPAHIIESVRLSQALASMRNLPRPGLNEHLESTVAVMCMGDEIKIQLIWRDLIVGSVLGRIPEGTPQVPIYTDFAKSIKSLRLKLATISKEIVLDLRQDNDLKKSILFHRLRILEIGWAREVDVSGKGTFKEAWHLEWDPEMTIQLIEKAIWGNDIEMAANNYLVHRAEQCKSLVEITDLVENSIPTDLSEGIEKSMARLDDLAASSSDIPVMVDTFPTLVQIRRYGNVRKTNLDMVSGIAEKIFNRILPGLNYAICGINEEEAQLMASRVKKMHDAVLLLEEEFYLPDWLQEIEKLTTLEKAASMVHGTCCKILYDQGKYTPEATAILFSRALSTGNSPENSAWWLEGFLMDGAPVLMFDDVIWGLINSWLHDLEEETFQEIIPLLRRTFASYNASEKRRLAMKLHQSGKPKEYVSDTQLNTDRARKILPTYRRLLNLNQSVE